MLVEWYVKGGILGVSLYLFFMKVLKNYSLEHGSIEWRVIERVL